MQIIAICGKSASGKSYFINQLLTNKDKYHYVKSYTTREVRKNDENDINTHTFVDDKFFEINKDKAIAMYHSPKGYHSWIDKDSFVEDKINLYAIDPIAVRDELYPYCEKNNIDLKIYYLYVPEYIRKRRYFEREGNLNGYSDEPHLDISQLKNIKDKVIVYNNY